jgi:hypothetical protein
MRWNFSPNYEWHRWFAWRPVFIGWDLVWLETIERQLNLDYDEAGYCYRDLVK